MDMEGFKPTMLPYIKSAIDVLRTHYPGRLGCACFINVPAYFYPVWRIIGPWLDEEILSKTFFLPKAVTDSELAVRYSDNAVLEAHHLARAFALLHEHKFLEGWTREAYAEFRRHAIRIVLMTDLSKHFDFISVLKTAPDQSSKPTKSGLIGENL